MYIYLDESGDTGFKFRQGSTIYFVIALLLVDNALPIHQAVHDIRVTLGKPDSYEFKFSSAGHDERVTFLNAIKHYPLCIRALVAHKPPLTSQSLHKRENFYDYIAKVALRDNLDSICGRTLVIDRKFKDKAPQNRLATYLRRELNTLDSQSNKPILKDVVYHDSREDNLLQVADMVVGAINRTYKERDDQYQRLLRRSIQHIQTFP